MNRPQPKLLSLRHEVMILQSQEKWKATILFGRFQKRRERVKLTILAGNFNACLIKDIVLWKIHIVIWKISKDIKNLINTINHDTVPNNYRIQGIFKCIKWS